MSKVMAWGLFLGGLAVAVAGWVAVVVSPDLPTLTVCGPVAAAGACCAGAGLAWVVPVEGDR